MINCLQPFSLYIHIPFCISKCPYCDFNSHVVLAIPERNYSKALLLELDYFAEDPNWFGRPVQTIFFGGGTPSTFKPATIAALLEAVSRKFKVLPDCEITLEANPGTIERNNFSAYRRAGVNRISVGIQSFQPWLLKFLGRVHGADDGRKALDVVRQSGFANFSFDLIFANPGQTLEDLAADLDIGLGFEPPHLSAYNLTFEEGTPFYHEYRAGRLQPLTEDQELAMAQLIESKLISAGLRRYEISNYAQPGRHCRHNLNYWQSGDYLGIGAGAHSYLALGKTGKRWSNEKNPGRYVSRVQEAHRAITGEEHIEFTQAAGEFMFLGLRMSDGVCCRSFYSRFGVTPGELYPKVENWLEEELMEEKNEYLRLTNKGMMLADSIFVAFV
jgi:oxygen-independent coproporphyrinogen III oxidase